MEELLLLTPKKTYDRINEALEDLLIKMYGEQDIETGKLTSEQWMRWHKVCEDGANLFTVLIQQNHNETRKLKEENAS